MVLSTHNILQYTECQYSLVKCFWALKKKSPAPAMYINLVQFSHSWMPFPAQYASPTANCSILFSCLVHPAVHVKFKQCEYELCCQKETHLQFLCWEIQRVSTGLFHLCLCWNGGLCSLTAFYDLQDCTQGEMLPHPACKAPPPPSQPSASQTEIAQNVAKVRKHSILFSSVHLFICCDTTVNF